MKPIELFKNDKKEIVINQYDNDDHIVLKFGQLEISINKDPKFRDIAIILNDCGAGVLWEDKYNNGEFNNQEAINGIKLHYMQMKVNKYKTIKEAFEYLKRGMNRMKQDIDFCWDERIFDKEELNDFTKEELITHILSLYEYVEVNTIT